MRGGYFRGKKHIIEENIPSLDELMHSMDFEDAKEIIAKAKEKYTVRTLKRYWGNITDYTLYNIVFKHFGLYDGYPSTTEEARKRRKEKKKAEKKRLQNEKGHQLEYSEISNDETELFDIEVKEIEDKEEMSDNKTTSRLVSLAEMYNLVLDDNEVEGVEGIGEVEEIKNDGVIESNQIQTVMNPSQIVTSQYTYTDSKYTTPKTVVVNNNQLIENQIINNPIQQNQLQEYEETGFKLKVSGIFNGEKVQNKLKSFASIIEEDNEYIIEVLIKEVNKQ